MNRELRLFIVKFAALCMLLFAIRSAFQVPVEYLRLQVFYEQVSDRIFSKGDALKSLSVIGVLFTMFCRDRISSISHSSFNARRSFALFICSIISVFIYYFARYLANANIAWPGIVMVSGLMKIISLTSAFAFLSLSVFQLSYASEFARKLRKELFFAGISVIALYFGLLIIQSQWRLFTELVLSIVTYMLKLFTNLETAYDAGDSMLRAGSFRVKVGAPCSGIDSMLLFAVFSLAIYALDHKALDKIRYPLLFAAGLAGAFLINAIRIFLLMLAGAYISPVLALGLFHTHAGWVLFIIYFAAYYHLLLRLSYKRDEK